MKENKIQDASPPGFKVNCPVMMIDTVALAEGQKLGSMKQNKELKHSHTVLQTALEKISRGSQFTKESVINSCWVETHKNLAGLYII